MSKKLWAVASLVGAAAAFAAAPVAFAGPTPVAGGESPNQTIRDLTNNGYDVQINWVEGYPSNIPLSQCTVTQIDTHAPPTAWVSINCPADGSQ